MHLPPLGGCVGQFAAYGSDQALSLHAKLRNNSDKVTTMTARITREQILEASGGMLKRQYYVVFSTPTNGLGPVMENLPVHLAHQCDIERLGILVAAGPHWTENEKFWDGDGMFVIRATSLSHATEIAASDPMHKAGARAFTVRPWLVNEGGLTIKVSFSDGKMTLE
jgi:hypothetical protein